MGRPHSLKVSSQNYRPTAQGKANSTVVKPGEHHLTQAIEAASEGRPVLRACWRDTRGRHGTVGALPLTTTRLKAHCRPSTKRFSLSSLNTGPGTQGEAEGPFQVRGGRSRCVALGCVLGRGAATKDALGQLMDPDTCCGFGSSAASVLNFLVFDHGQLGLCKRRPPL